MSDVTRILAAIEGGDAQASAELLPLVYGELRRLAAARLAQESPGQTLQATALVHEAYLRLLGAEGAAWQGRGHFFAAAAEAMRRILIEQARRKKRIKHGGGRRKLQLDEGLDVAAPEDCEDFAAELVALDAALEKFAAEDPAKAELVKLRYFAGLTGEQAAAVLGISRATAARHWTYARAWLYHEMSQCEMSQGEMAHGDATPA